MTYKSFGIISLRTSLLLIPLDAHRYEKHWGGWCFSTVDRQILSLLFPPIFQLWTAAPFFHIATATFTFPASILIIAANPPGGLPCPSEPLFTNVPLLSAKA